VNGLDLGIIGNGTVSALLNARGDVVWFCNPRLDGDPVFCSLLAGEPQSPRRDGTFAVGLENFAASEQRYLPNTAVLRTVQTGSDGASLEIVDFCPRFSRHGRDHRPTSLIRLLRPLRGDPVVRVRVRPMYEYGKGLCERTSGSNHVRYVGSAGGVLRVTTNMPVTALIEERPMVLDRPRALLLGADETLADAPGEVAEVFLRETTRYWQDWVRHLSIPFEWQEAVIRAAITLRLSVYEDTGAIVAAPTTSLPEAENARRNWDYRFCWLRDSFFVVRALNRLGATGSMEHFLHYLTNLVAGMDGDSLQPVYAINGEARLTESDVSALPGYRGMGPVRVGNEAYRQQQHDVYGAVVLALSQLLFDARIVDAHAEPLLERLERVGALAVQCFAQPDAGIWELRGTAHVHTFSSLMCWAACDRLARISRWVGKEDKARHWQEHARGMHTRLMREAWNERLGSFVATFGGESLDASLLMMFELGFLRGDDPRMLGTLAAIERELRRGRFIFRYAIADDFGEPENAFLVCTFWYVDALALAGRREEARELFEHLLSVRNHHGLMAEHIDPPTGEMWGNFPQTYSMVGIINSALRLSTRWEDAF